MTQELIYTAAVPTISGNPDNLDTAATDLDAAATDVTDASELVTAAWAGINDENYHAPEAPGVKQSMPKITAPMDTLGSNVTAIATALTTASSSLATLKTRRTTLVDDIIAFRSRALAADSADTNTPGVCTVENPSGLTGWRADPMMVQENSGLWTRSTTLQTDIDDVETFLLADLWGIEAPSPHLPAPSWTPGVDAGSHAEIAGPGASAYSWSGATWQNGNYYFGAGAEAEAHLVQGNAVGRWDGGAWGTGQAGASFDVGARANAQATGSIGVDGIHGRASASASAGVNAQANVSHEIGTYTVGAGVKGMAGAEANANAGLDIGADGLAASAGVTAFAGAKAEGNVTVENMGVTGKVGADVRAGIGGEAKVDLQVTSEEVRIKLDVGFAIGVGAGVDLDLSFKPAELIEDVQSFLPDIDLNPFS